MRAAGDKLRVAGDGGEAGAQGGVQRTQFAPALLIRLPKRGNLRPQLAQLSLRGGVFPRDTQTHQSLPGFGHRPNQHLPMASAACRHTWSCSPAQKRSKLQ